MPHLLFQEENQPIRVFPKGLLPPSGPASTGFTCDFQVSLFNFSLRQSLEDDGIPAAKDLLQGVGPKLGMSPSTHGVDWAYWRRELRMSASKRERAHVVRQA